MNKKKEPLRVLVADDSVLLREGIVSLLRDAGMEVVGQAGDAQDLLRKARAHKPDVAIVDVRMPPTHNSEGLEAAKTIQSELPEIAILVVSQYTDMFQASESLLDGAAGFGYLLKDRIVDVPQFLDSLMRVANGGSAIDPEIVSHMLGRKSRERDLDVLSERELEVLALMAEGRTNHAIGEHMTITTRAAEKHVSSIFTKLDLEATPDDHRRVLAVLKYLELQ
jgi:DNA-binding NarL/FixJ family response regulator